MNVTPGPPEGKSVKSRLFELKVWQIFKLLTQHMFCHFSFFLHHDNASGILKLVEYGISRNDIRVRYAKLWATQMSNMIMSIVGDLNRFMWMCMMYKRGPLYCY